MCNNVSPTIAEDAIKSCPWAVFNPLQKSLRKRTAYNLQLILNCTNLICSQRLLAIHILMLGRNCLRAQMDAVDMTDVVQAWSSQQDE